MTTITLPRSTAVTPRAAAAPPARQQITAQPALIDLLIYQGDDFFLDVQVNWPDGTPLDASTMSPMSQIRDSTADVGDVLASFTITLDTTTLGLMHLRLATADSTALPARCAWDLQLTLPTVTTLIAGNVTVTREVTR
jgi:hypothetical protein